MISEADFHIVRTFGQGHLKKGVGHQCKKNARPVSDHPGLRQEELLVLAEGVTVGHSRDVIADFYRKFILLAWEIFGWEFIGILQVIISQFP